MNKHAINVSCGKSFTTASYLKKHIYSIHEGHKDYKFKSEDGLIHHSKIHNEKNIKNKAYKCNYESTYKCMKSFDTKHQLKTHKTTVHEKSFNCNICIKAFGTKNQFQIHNEKMHQNKK